MIRVRLNYTGPAAGFSVFHFDGDLTATNPQDCADALDTWIGTFNDQFATTQSMQVDPEVLEVDPVTGQTIAADTVTTAAINGAGSATQVPQLAQFLVRWRSGAFVGGREIRGRTFLPGGTAGASTATGEVQAATIAAIDAASATLITNSSIGTWSPARGTFAPSASASTWSEFASMRGRRQ